MINQSLLNNVLQSYAKVSSRIPIFSSIAKGYNCGNNILKHPHSMRGRSDISFRPHIGRDVADHAETLSRRHDWYLNEINLLETYL